jgi:CRISPR-associated protein Cas1
LAQGSPLSPLLANLVLEHVDERLSAAGFPAIRFADDLAVVATSLEEAWEAARVAATAVEEMGMGLGAEDTAVMSFDEGFVLLGEDFGPRYPPVLDDPLDVPDRRTVFVGRPGSRVRLDEGRVLVEHQDVELLSVPAGLVARITCFGAVGVSSGLRNWALATGVDLAFCSQRGRYLGSAVSGRATRAHRLRRQVEDSADESGFLPFGRSVVEAKIRKQIVLLRRLTVRDHAAELTEAVSTAQSYLRMLPDALTREEIMGVEGIVARTYFQAWQHLLPAEMAFTGRNRRPPLDVVNSALSYGYAVVVAEAVSALVAAGLEPAIGFLHRDEDDWPSLALDRVEEFRPLVIDQVVVEAVRQRRLRPEHGRRDEERGGVLLTTAGREVLLDGYERRMLRMTRGALPDFAGSLRRHLYRQAQSIASWIEGIGPVPVGLSWR